jgi:hypothetical protein
MGLQMRSAVVARIVMVISAVCLAQARGQQAFTPPVLTNLSVPTSITVNQTATLTGSIGDSEQNGFRLAINWGDLPAVQLVQIPAGSNSFSVIHQYADNPQAGTSFTPYTINVTVTDTDGVNNTDFLSALFQDLLGRAISPSELTFYLNFFNQGVTRSVVAGDLTATSEYRQRLVGDYYQRFLRRQADPAGINAGVALLAGGVSDEQYIATITGSMEYFNTRGGGNNNGFLDAIYFDLLGRAVDPPARSYFTAQMNAGVTTTQVSTNVLGSSEYRNDLVTALFWRFLQRPPNSSDASYYVNLLNSGLTDEQLIGNIMGSVEYFNNRSGGTATARASIVVSNLPPVLTVTSLVLVNGLPHLAGNGAASQTYTIQTSSDLMNWANSGTITSDNAGSFSFDDPGPALPVRFYRIRSP